MGPQRFSCGNTIGYYWWFVGYYASMGPQRFSCGNRDRAGDEHQRQVASMGPQRFSCGNGLKWTLKKWT